MDAVYKPMTKGPISNKPSMKSKMDRGNIGGYGATGDNLFGNASSSKFMPSNLSGFYMPYITPQNTDQDQYGYDIEIEERKVRQEDHPNYSRKPPLRKSVLSEREQEDDVAVPLEEVKSYSRSPVKKQLSIERQTNGSFVQKPSISKKMGNTGSVPAAQMYSNFDPRQPEINKVNVI
jgi:hypothetical protein